MISSSYRLPVRGGRLLRGAALGAVAAACLVSLTACGGGSSGTSDPQVASLPSTGAASGASQQAGGQSVTSANSTGRPQERLDDTPQQDAAYIRAWDVCLVAHGAHYSGMQGKDGPDLADPLPSAALAACVDKLPLLPPELVSGTNPNYLADWKAEVACMRSHGVLVHLVSETDGGDPNGLTYTFDSGTASAPADLGQVDTECQTAAFGG
jgi:hypothetical protein